ncbi:MAG: hypothetical protein LW862_08590 [Rubrivivax sp.]|nr:hypothetical protein [Rubrivivax sp.]
MTDQPRPQGQLDVQRWLGRCMLGHEASHATVSGADLEQLGRFALFCALSALRGLA